MPYLRPYVLAFILLLPFFTYGQMKKFSLYGTAQSKDGAAYPYHVVFDIKGNTLSGYSVTHQPTGIDFTAQISGQIDRLKHTLRITETRSLDNLSPDMQICLFDAILTYKLQGGKYIISGNFTGNGKGNSICGGGIMRFEDVNDPGSIFYEKKKAIPKAKPLPPKQDTTVAHKETITATNTITEGVQKVITWISDTCVLEVWDGGVIDGDVISVFYNDNPALLHYTLEKAHKQLRIPVKGKKNIITVVADEEGANPPNTADILVIDGKDQYKITAYNKKGKKAAIVLMKR